MTHANTVTGGPPYPYPPRSNPATSGPFGTPYNAPDPPGSKFISAMIESMGKTLESSHAAMAIAYNNTERAREELYRARIAIARACAALERMPTPSNWSPGDVNRFQEAI